MNTLSLILSIFNLFALIGLAYLILRLNVYIDKSVIAEIDKLYDQDENLKKNLQIAIKEDYLEDEDTLKVKRPLIRK